MPQRTEPQQAESTPKPVASWYVQGLSDGLGDRLLMFDNTGAPSLELLRLHPDLAQIPGFEEALKQQVRRLAEFQHPAFAAARSVQRLEPDDDLALISNYTPGKRLSEVLHRANGPEFATALIEQLAPALVLFQQHSGGTAHGFLTTDRIVVGPDGRLTIVEHAVGPALDMLNLRPAQLSSIGVALPPAATDGQPLDASADWYQLGLVAMSVLMGRPVTPSDVPQLETLLDGLGGSTDADGMRVSPFMRRWLNRALQISGERIDTGADAKAAVDELLDGRSNRVGRAERPLIERSYEEELTPPERLRPDCVNEAAPIDAVASFPVERPQARPPQRDESLRQPREVRPPRQPSSQVRPPASQGSLAMFEREALAEKQRILEFRAATPIYDPPAETRPVAVARERRGVSGGVFAAIALIAVVEAGAIAMMARSLWFAQRPGIVAEPAISGDDLLLRSSTPNAVPLGIAVAPDLRWVRVTSSASVGTGGKAGETAGPAAIQINSPIALKVLEGGRLLGSVPGPDIKVAPGRHELELVNTALGYQLRQTIDAGAGQTVSIQLAQPHGMVTIDASPWADVSVDGKAIGRTPLGPLPLPLGEHQITFSNPAGSSDRQRVAIKSDGVTRIVGNLKF